jgi:uncharacterized membrane protein YeaQ/YmgE (transglycosylase-associated protein family)
MIELLVLFGLILLAWVIFSAVISLTVTLVEFAVLILVWIFIGYVTGQLIRGKGYGPLNDALLGLGGGIIGNLVFGLLNVDLGGIIGTIMAGVIGAVILVFIIRAVSENKNFAK